MTDTTTEYQPRTPERLIKILRAQDQNPRSWQAEAAAQIGRLLSERAEALRSLGIAFEVIDYWRGRNELPCKPGSNNELMLKIAREPLTRVSA